MASIINNTSPVNKKIVIMLYRNTLKAARVYGEAAEIKRMAAVEEFASFNKDLKMQMIAPRNSLNRGVMTPALALSATRQMFQKAKSASPAEHEELFGDALSAYKKLNQKLAMFKEFPIAVDSEQVVNGMKIEAKSRFVGMTPQSGKYRYQINVRFTNQTSQTLQLLTENVYARDETMGEFHRQSGLVSLTNKLPSVLKGSGVYELATKVSLPTELGYCACDYLFADAQTGAVLRVSIPPLLLSTHDPDTDYRESCYRGDPSVDLQVVAKLPEPKLPELKTEVVQFSPPKNNGSSQEWIRRKADDEINNEIDSVEEEGEGESVEEEASGMTRSHH